MTDHSILRPSVPEFPFHKEARLLTSVVTAIFVELPRSFAAAVRARKIYEDLWVMDAPGLAALGINRDGISRFAIEHSGMLPEKAE
jgi:hypothetical protein